MSTEENKAVIRRLVDAWNTGQTEGLDKLIAPDYMRHRRGTTKQRESGPEWYREGMTGIRAIIPDWLMTIDELLADGDKVIWRLTASGTLVGADKTPWGAPVPATGNKVSFTGILISRIADGKIAEEWWETGLLTYYQQVGAIPSPTS
jgi:predicted ester cyclase